MTALEALREPKRIEKEMNAVMKQIEEARSRLMPGGVDYELDRVQTTPRDRFAEVMGQIDELERKLDDLADQREKSRKRVLLLLEQVTNKDARIIINLHDVLEFEMDTVAEVVFMSRSNCYLLRGQGLSEISLDTLDTEMWYGEIGD